MDRTITSSSGHARVLVFNGVHAAFPIYDADGKEAGHADVWRTEVEVFFPKDQLPENSLTAATSAAMTVCGRFKQHDILEEHAHYVRLAAEC
jgi:hypothetical protein